MANNKQLPPGQAPAPQNATQLFGLATYRVPGGYLAQARIATSKGYVLFGASAKKQEYVAGTIDDPPKAAAVKEVLEQAADYINSPKGQEIVPNRVKYALSAVQATRDLVERAESGDGDAVAGLRRLSKSPHRMLRKALHAQRLYEE